MCGGGPEQPLPLYMVEHKEGEGLHRGRQDGSHRFSRADCRDSFRLSPQVGWKPLGGGGNLPRGSHRPLFKAFVPRCLGQPKILAWTAIETE